MSKILLKNAATFNVSWICVADDQSTLLGETYRLTATIHDSDSEMSGIYAKKIQNVIDDIVNNRVVLIKDTMSYSLTKHGSDVILSTDSIEITAESSSWYIEIPNTTGYKKPAFRTTLADYIRSKLVDTLNINVEVSLSHYRENGVTPSPCVDFSFVSTGTTEHNTSRFINGRTFTLSTDASPHSPIKNILDNIASVYSNINVDGSKHFESLNATCVNKFKTDSMTVETTNNVAVWDFEPTLENVAMQIVKDYGQTLAACGVSKVYLVCGEVGVIATL